MVRLANNVRKKGVKRYLFDVLTICGKIYFFDTLLIYVISTLW